MDWQWITGIIVAIILTLIPLLIKSRKKEKRVEEKQPININLSPTTNVTQTITSQQIQNNNKDTKKNDAGVKKDKKQYDKIKDKQEEIEELDIKSELLIEEVVSVESNNHEHLEFNLQEGDYIKGRAFEVDGKKYDFNLYLVDEENFTNYRDDLSFECLLEIEERSSISIDIIIPYPDRWYFIFDNSGKRISRDIDVRIERYYEEEGK